ncbi:MAG: apolipoprotein N-acyltransferase [Bdellovibrionales bacterium]
MKTNFMEKRVSFLKQASLPILTGLLIGTSYIPFPPWAIFFCFVPLWIFWLKENSYKRIFWSGWAAQFILTAIGFNWVAYTVHEFGHLPWILALGTLLLFCTLANLHIPLVGLIWFYLSRRLKLRDQEKIWLLPLLMAVAERTFPMIFDWHLGYTWLWAGFPAFHLADIVGFIGLSNIGLFFNGFFVFAWWLHSQKRTWAWAAAVPFVVFLSMNVWGHNHGHGEWEGDAKLKFLVVQANIGNQEKLQSEQGWLYRNNVIGKFTTATQKGLNEQGHADFAVWPETAFPDIIDTPDLSVGYSQQLKNFIVSSQTKLITGGYTHQEGSGKITNSFFALGNDGHWLAKPYHKTVLLAFGEYMPFGEYFPALSKAIPEVGDFGRGPGPTVVDAGGVKLGAIICYEGLFDWFVRDLGNKGAQIIVNLTNDSWYGKWEEPFQHGYMTLARAIEVRRPLVRSTNTGLSTVILANGDILAQSPLHETWSHLYEIPYATNPQPTLFMSWGFWLIPALLLLGFIAIAWRGRRNE